MMRSVVLIGACLATGCATAASGPELSRLGEETVEIYDRSGSLYVTRLQIDDQTQTAELSLDFETAWTRLYIVLPELGLSIGHIDQETGRMSQSAESVSRLAGERLSTYLDCGVGATAQPYADYYAVSLSYEVLVDPAAVGSILPIEMRIEATARPRDVSSNPLRCRSKGTLEHLVFERLQSFG